jgi:hypothetical protein
MAYILDESGNYLLDESDNYILDEMPILVNPPSTWTPEVINPASWTDTSDPNPDTWLLNPQPPIDTWDDANRTWDSAYTWDGTIQQTTDAVPSSWTEV